MTEQRKEGRRGQGEKKESGRRISEPGSYLGRKEERGAGRKEGHWTSSKYHNLVTFYSYLDNEKCCLIL